MRQPCIGILAGMGPRSTAPFIDLVVTECQKQYGAREDIDFPKMLICSQPAPFYEDRPTDHAALETAIRAGLLHLERSGVDFLAIACNTAHIYYPRLEASVGVPLLNMVELGVAALPATARRVAILAARPTIEAGIYQDALTRRGLVFVDPGWQDRIDHLLGLTRTTTDALVQGKAWEDLLGMAHGADAILVACMDLSAVAARAGVHARVVDAAVALAQEIVRQWLQRRRHAARGESNGPILELVRGAYRITTDPTQIDLAAVHRYLAQSYWSPGVSREVLAKATAASLCFSLFHGTDQVGLARVITDRATFAYLCDVYILEAHRGQGLSKWLMEAIVGHSWLQGLRSFVLITRDAHGLYERFGFVPLSRPEGYMEVHRPDAYLRSESC